MSGTDLISRQAAIETVEHITSSMSVCVNSDECHGMKRMQRQAVIELTSLPSAQPEPKTGQWIPDEIAAYDMPNGEPRGWVPWLCSECGYCVGKHQTRFCPDCGALMCGKAK